MQKQKVIVGVDEAGRGAFLGRMYSAAAVYCPDTSNPSKVVVRDSKKMTPRQRSLTCDYLVENILYGVGWCDEKEIDSLGVTRCNILSMHRALEDLLQRNPDIMVEKIHVDGVLFEPFQDIPYETIVKGDNSHPEIMAASILAKTHRDRYIEQLCDENPVLQENYLLRNNKGYGTAKHVDGIRKHGINDLHRKTFVKNYCPRIRFLK